MIIAIDFDGTCVTHSFPEVGHDVGAAPVLRKLVYAGHQLILWTMRSDGQEEQVLDDGYEIHSGDFLTQAVEWFTENDIPLYGIQQNPTQNSWTTSPKCHAQLYIDDAALGCPLKFVPDFSSRPFADWELIEKYLIENKLIKWYY